LKVESLKTMDKSKKILLIIIGVCILSFCGVKACSNEVKKNITADSVISAISEAAGRTTTVNYDDAERYMAASEGSIDANRVNEIHIEWVNGDILVQYGDQDQITWKETFRKGEANEKSSLHYYMDEDELNLAFCQAGNQALKGNSRLKKDLVVTLPQNWRLRELEIDNVNGTITSQVDANEISAESVNGDKFITTNGSREISLDGVNGSSTIYLPATAAFRAEFDKVNGGFSSDFPVEKEGKTYTSGRAPYVDIEVEVVNGSLNIKKQ